MHILLLTHWFYPFLWAVWACVGTRQWAAWYGHHKWHFITGLSCQSQCTELEGAVSNNLHHLPHVLAHLLKSFRAHNVKSSSTLFLDNIQWNFEIPFPCARFYSLLGYNLITKSSDHQKWDFQAPIAWNWKKHALMWDILLWKTRVPIEFETYQDG